MNKSILSPSFKTTLALGVIIALAPWLSSCSNSPIVQDFPETASPGAEVSSLDADINTARTLQVNVLSPHNFEAADHALNSAKKSLDQQKEAKVTLHRVAEGRAYLVRSNEFAKVGHENIEDVINARDDSVKAGAPNLFPSDFKKADQNLKEATADIEQNNLKNVIKNRTTLQASYLDLELKSIKQNALGQVRDMITLAIQEGAKQYAPQSLAKAQKCATDTDAFINANRHYTQAVAAKTAEAQESADHLLKITRSSKANNKVPSEEIALKIENDQNAVSEKDAQLNSKQKQLDHKQNQLTREKDASIALTAENKNLAADQAFNRSFEEARLEFSNNEAEVYKQGNTLMIRLRGLEFTTAKAELKGSNFPLLAKVQKVIKDFGKSTVIVEGHTDSRGGKALNEKLSTNRAEAVKDYFVSNTGSDPLEIKSVGYDYQKPLATNKTAQGRAQNRRVDVLITAEEPGKI